MSENKSEANKDFDDFEQNLLFLQKYSFFISFTKLGFPYAARPINLYSSPYSLKPQY